LFILASLNKVAIFPIIVKNGLIIMQNRQSVEKLISVKQLFLNLLNKVYQIKIITKSL